VIPDELKYGTDESGLQKGVGQKTRGRYCNNLRRWYINSPSGDLQGRRISGKVETGQPVPHRLGYSKKGYTDGEIGRAWIENFDKVTRVKANGRRRLLLVDGHVSHYTRAFLEYAREHRIEVVGYPSHSTHIYQGLDVVIFSPMKRNWTQVRDRWEREGHTKQTSRLRFKKRVSFHLTHPSLLRK